jgi:TonB-dependent starch-binding outer membrane protein SusC
MGKTKWLLLMGFLLSCQLLWAQVQVSGRVTDSKDGTPMPGVSVSVKNGTTSTITGPAGEFNLNVAQGSILVFTYVGYQSIERPAAANMTISLSQGESQMEEIVVTGYTSIQRRKFSGSSSQVSPTEVRKQPFGSFDQALQGQAAGVSVVAGSGQPGANAVVRIRGNGSISGGNVPLYILDGIQITAADFASLNQGDFESVEILKDAVATSQYGSRGANGVIVITTRKGRAGTIELNYDAQVGISNIPEDRLIVMNSSQKIDYEIQRGNPYGWNAAKQDSLKNVNFNWKDALFQTGMTRQHQLSARGGSQTSRFYGSLSYMDQEGTVQTTGLKRYTARVNVDNNINNFRFGIGLTGGYSKIVGTSEGNTFLSAPLNALRWANPYERDRNPLTGDFSETGGPNTGNLTSGQPNPSMELFLNYNNSLQVKGVATSYLEFHFPFVKGLYARTNWGIDYGQNESSGFTSPRTSVGIARQGILSRGFNRNLRYQGTSSINYKKTMGLHEIDGGVFAEVIKSTFRSMGFTGYGFTNGFTNEAGITAGSVANPNYIPAVGGSGTENGLLSYFGIFNYTYNNRYNLTLTGRRDGSSRFGINNRWANFGSVGVKWFLADENFIKDITFINDLAVRASFGTTGSNNAPTGDFPIPVFGRIAYAGIAGWSPASPGNLDYGWETNRTINFGLDWALFNRRLSGSLDLYDRETQDLFYSIPIDPSISGFGSIPSNFGSLRNRGFELMLRGDVIRTREITWNIQGNIALNRNQILDIPQDSVISGITILAEGRPLNSLFLVPYAGVNSANGNALYIKKDGSLTETFSVADKVILGTSDAPWYGGLSTSVTFRGFDASAQLNFFLGREMFNNDRVNVTNPAYFFDNMDVELLKEWRRPGDVTNVPRPTASGGNAFQSQTTRFVEDASFWRLRNVTLGYNVPSKILSRAKIRTARVFFQGQNLWTQTAFRSFDPEMTGVSLTGAQYPALIQKTLGLSIGF